MCEQKERGISDVARHFMTAMQGCRIERLGEGCGNINVTYLVQNGQNLADWFVLQRINPHVFPRPETVAENGCLVADYICGRGKAIVPQGRRTTEGCSLYRDASGWVWKAQAYLTGTTSFIRPEQPWMPYQLGLCLARFHVAVVSLDASLLLPALPGFHDLPGYLRSYDSARALQTSALSDVEQWCCGMVETHRTDALSFREQITCQEQMVIHGDPKLANVLFDVGARRAVAMIDLDTVGPGYRLVDIGDMLRSVAVPSGEEPEDEEIALDLESLEQALRGYTAEQPLSPMEKSCCYGALFSITYELALRFLTDHLQGDCYFTAAYRGQNLERARVQFTLLEKIIKNRQAVEEIALHTEGKSG